MYISRSESYSLCADISHVTEAIEVKKCHCGHGISRFDCLGPKARSFPQTASTRSSIRYTRLSMNDKSRVRMRRSSVNNSTS